MFLDKDQHFFEFLDVLAVNYEVQRHTDAVFLQPFEHAQLLRMRRGVGNFARGLLVRSLKT